MSCHHSKPGSPMMSSFWACMSHCGQLRARFFPDVVACGHVSGGIGRMQTVCEKRMGDPAADPVQAPDVRQTLQAHTSCCLSHGTHTPPRRRLRTACSDPGRAGGGTLQPRTLDLRRLPRLDGLFPRTSRNPPCTSGHDAAAVPHNPAQPPKTPARLGRSTPTLRSPRPQPPPRATV